MKFYTIRYEELGQNGDLHSEVISGISRHILSKQKDLRLVGLPLNEMILEADIQMIEDRDSQFFVVLPINHGLSHDQRKDQAMVRLQKGFDKGIEEQGLFLLAAGEKMKVGAGRECSSHLTYKGNGSFELKLKKKKDTLLEKAMEHKEKKS